MLIVILFFFIEKYLMNEYFYKGWICAKNTWHRIPIYSISTIISLSSKRLSDYIDIIRDIYEVIFTTIMFIMFIISNNNSLGFCYLFLFYFIGELLGRRKGYSSPFKKQASYSSLVAFSLFFISYGYEPPTDLFANTKGYLTICSLKTFIRLVCDVIKNYGLLSRRLYCLG